ncbi:hypothetical protein O9G_000561 [Rozella allomycis CSF55]|uniref:Uncharacterized protein n=1 Tax=Rozella allomycis (strain CSF55) TaxID=988480 RepID=A0A075B089_ROZAC|nr:hypothetical protein O9G_000561 [Rozella allomycis CSF55]|eukprot:EPZ34374.1 hypothetical protein O9G_000561 [Rozella allomycis CSF55]
MNEKTIQQQESIMKKEDVRPTLLAEIVSKCKPNPENMANNNIKHEPDANVTRPVPKILNMRQKTLLVFFLEVLLAAVFQHH